MIHWAAFEMTAVREHLFAELGAENFGAARAIRSAK
jgi:hypothetical protein